MRRIVLALAALVCLTAFAPAPFPRKERGVSNQISLEALRGIWRVVDFESVKEHNGRSKIGQWFQQVRIDGNQWHYVVAGERQERTPYSIAIDGSKRPGTIDFTSQGATTVGMVGLVQREGDRVTVLYYATTPAKRAQSFESPPTGWWVLTLERQK